MMIMPRYQETLQVQPGDKRLESEYISYKSPKGGGEIRGLLSKPAGAEQKLPEIIVVHENRGLNPHIEDVGRRAALAGFVSLAPDALTPLGAYPGNDDDGRTLQRKRDRNEMLEDFIAAYEYLKADPACSGKVGVVGFCFGGWISNKYTAHIYPDVNHGFHNDSTPRYDKAAAELAWERTIAFFKDKLV